MEIIDLAAAASYFIYAAFFTGRYIVDKSQRPKMQEESFIALVCYLLVAFPFGFYAMSRGDISIFGYVFFAVAGALLLVYAYGALMEALKGRLAWGVQFALMLCSFGFEIARAFGSQSPEKALFSLGLWYFIGIFAIACGAVVVGPLLFMLFPTNTEKLITRPRVGRSQVSLEAWALGIGFLYPIWMLARFFF